MNGLSDKIVVYIGIILEVIILIIGVFVLNFNTSEAVDIIQAICAVINLIVVILFFIISDISRKNEMKNNNKQYWFKKYIVSEFLPIFDNFFNELTKTVKDISEKQYASEVEKEEKLEEILVSFSNNLRTIIQTAYPKINVISPSLADEIKQKLQKIEDEYSEHIEFIIYLPEQRKNDNVLCLEKLISSTQTNIFELLYKYGEKIDFM